VRRWLALAGALLAVQLVLVGLYALSSSGEPDPAFVWERLDEPAPASLDVGEGVVVVHFWATWCAPCRTELPELLVVAEDEGARLMALTDEPAPVVERFFDGEMPTAIAFDAEGRARRDYGVSGMPDTFLVRDGRIVARVGGPRRWDSEAGRRFLSGEPR
jgi:thiol-disulfide isomerase/thioredoxin